ncbi:UNVERIFIED_CONTAM: hypothetical protein Sradi_3190000 [Sesamum radiatum]|uniref:Zinc knuckle CX2CX4HX4C domain-containing protein n=1 Tax=Sesamum radiatum TaxID=300843 RepID=A0AAW2RF73_SESRA
MSNKVALVIGNKLGRMCKVDQDKNGAVWGSSIRIRVASDVMKPLKRALKIRTVFRDEQLVTFTYERLPNFYYYCGCLGYISRSCELQFREAFIDPKENTPFGSWLWVTLPSLQRGRSSNSS